jgi:uncharacterized membrane protein
MPAIVGASSAGFLVIFLGFVIHRPLSRVPENFLKFFVGVLLSSFGVFWIGESFRYSWPGEDFAIPLIALTFFAVSWLSVKWIARTRVSIPSGGRR